MIPVFIDQARVPHKPGVYIYKDSAGKILYVGKAVNLYHRVASYFNKQLDPKTASLVERIKGCETIEVTSELEALILEANLIKKYCPPYNVKLTDDKDYLYIKITKGDFPQVLTARKQELTDATDYFGPFPSSKTVRETLKKLRRIFPWCSNPISKNGRPCFYYHLHLCPGACIDKISRVNYRKIINRFKKFLKGKKEELICDLQKEMNQYSESLAYEKAQATKKILEGILYLTQPNLAQVYLENPNFIEDQNKKALLNLQCDLHLSKLPERIECFDISNLQGKEATGALVVLTGGVVDKRWYRKFKIRLLSKPNDTAMIEEMIGRRIKHSEWPQPDLILVDGGKGQVSVAYKVLKQNGWDVPVFGLAKRREWLYSFNKEVVKLPKSSLSLQLLQKIRDEAHRFATLYHQKLRRLSFGV